MVTASPEAVWARAVTPAGINHEMRPWMTMSMPRGLDGTSLEDVAIGVPLGKAWLRLFGLVPFDYDDLMVESLGPGLQFHENSTMLAFRRWEHVRRVEPAGENAVVTDRVTFEPRLPIPGLGALASVILRAFFAHRQRRLAAHFVG